MQYNNMDKFEIVGYVNSTLAVERMKASDGAMQCCERVLNGSMTADEAVEEIKRMYGVAPPEMVETFYFEES